MGKKSKKKDRKKVKDAVPEDMLDAAALSIRKFRKVTHELSKLSTGQKLLGSLVLVAAGLIYLDQRQDEDGSNPEKQDAKRDWARLAEAKATSATAAPDEPTRPAQAAPHKSRKAPRHTLPKASKQTG
jgi:hypothetical protein